MSAWRWIESVLVLLPVRLVLAGVFGVAGALKLADPQSFGFAVKAFKIFDPQRAEHVLVMLTFGIPWAELLAAVLVLLGFWARGAGLLLSALTVAFLAGQLSLISRGIDTECACFGKLEFICAGPVGWCHVGRNAVLLVGALLIVWRGAGLLSIDGAREGGSAGRVDGEGGAA